MICIRLLSTDGTTGTANTRQGELTWVADGEWSRCVMACRIGWLLLLFGW
jgi:hypothetical protein